MNLNGRLELLIGAVIIAVLAVAVVLLLIVPQFGRMGELDAKLDKANRDIQAAQGLLAQRQSAKAQAAQTQAQLLTLQNELPDNPELPSLIIELQNAANASGLLWVKVQPQTPQDRGGYEAVPMQLTMSGSWSDMTDYVRRISDLERQIRITGVDFKPQDLSGTTSGTGTTSSSTETSATSGPVTLTASIQLEAYVMSAATGTTPTGTSTGQ